MKIHSLHVATFLLLLNFISKAQNETRKWYFGGQAGLDFMSNPPTIMANSAMYTAEGCSSTSDAAGNILFYTDGVTVWNQSHLPMANGTGLLGDPSCTQSGLIIKQPGTANLYYIFTMDEIGKPNGLRYSIVDITLAAGMGSVTTKNVLLYTPTAEKLAAVKHCNGKDIWIVTHDFNSNNFRSYLLMASGINTVAVLSPIGQVINNQNNSIGQMKISPMGKKIGMAWQQSNFELYDFDPATGIVSNSLNIGPNYGACYGCEFSPDGSKFYGARYINAMPPSPVTQIIQWDLCAGSNTAILASQYSISIPHNTLVSINMNSMLKLTGMQIAPNGKIYVAIFGDPVLSIINNPNLPAAACNYSHAVQSVSPKVCRFGLPSFMASYFKQAGAPFTYTADCQTVTFTNNVITNTVMTNCANAVYPILNTSWNFGDPASGGANTSTLNNPVHLYTAGGSFTVQQIFNYACSSDTILQVITTGSNFNLSIAGTNTICAGQTVTLTAGGADTYSWTNAVGAGSSSAGIAVNPTVTTNYTIVGTSTLNGCTSTRVVTVTVNKCVSVGEEDAKDQTRIYPNPAYNELTVDASGTVRIILSDQYGSVLMDKILEKGVHSIDISNITSGVYILKYVSGKFSKTTRLVKLKN